MVGKILTYLIIIFGVAFISANNPCAWFLSLIVVFLDVRDWVIEYIECKEYAKKYANKKNVSKEDKEF